MLMLGIIGIVISVYQFVLFIRFIMPLIDKVDTNSVHPAIKSTIAVLKSMNIALIPITEPVLAPIRDKVTVNNIDLSPLVVSLVLNIIARALNIL
jgi:uncharacterized protein YggT (Ycf19 family)